MLLVGSAAVESEAKRRHIVAQRLEIRFLGTRLRAEGIAGIVGAVMVVVILLAVYA